MAAKDAEAQARQDAILARLLTLHPKIIDLSLDRIERLLETLGHPERALPPVIHVAGTNGKGSVVAFLEAILRAAGLRVDAYISPHLVRFNERLRLDGCPIDDDALCAVLAECEAANDGVPITFFEVTTAAALLAFSRRRADVLLLEVGLGGRFDATNVVDRPNLTVITPVSIDHTQYLGDSLGEIAFEKAGILKPDVPAVVGPQEPDAVRVIADRASAIGAPLLCHGADWRSGRSGDALRFTGFGRDRLYPAPGLAGPHQWGNAGIALAATYALPGFDIAEDAMAAGLRDAVWPGRLQRLALPAVGASDWELWLDGGHNAAAGLALGEVAKAWDDRPLHLVVGMLNTKPPEDFLRPLAPHATSLVAVPVPGGASEDPSVICGVARTLDLDAETAETAEAAIDHIIARAPVPGRILVCGSLYLVGVVLAAAESPTPGDAPA